MRTSGPRGDLAVVVVGAGPAGTTTARLLARDGAHVRLIEARHVPRHKLCGGGLTPKAIPLLPPRALECVVRRVSAFVLAGGRLGRPTLALSDVEVAMVERATFDAALAREASNAGAEVLDGEPVLDARRGDERRRPAVRTRSGWIEADVVVAADGEPSRIARRVALGGEPRRRALALEVDLPLDPRRSPSALELRFGVRAGYAWYFPKGDHANVGILTADPRRQAALRAGLRRYAAELGLPLGDARIQGHWIPMSLRQGPLAGGRILLAGDAAGAADPFFGEGIAYALASGEIAADVVRRWAGADRDRAGDAFDSWHGSDALEAYDARLRAALAPAFARLALVGAIADAIPSLSIAALTALPWARREARRGLLGLGAPFALPAPASR